MTIVRVGTNAKFAAGWEQAFGGKKSKAATPAKAAAKKAAKKAPAPKKKAAKKKSGKK